MELNDNIFRANDIRGIAFEDLTEEVVFALGKALGTESINRKQADFIIGSIDNSGYIRRSDDEIIDDLAFTQNIIIEKSDFMDRNIE